MDALLLMDETGSPAQGWSHAPLTYSGNMCGIYLSYLPPVPGGAANPALFLSWFYDRYPADIRARIRQDYKARGFTDVLLSWPDARAVGATPESFASICREWVRDGVYVSVMLSSKDFDPSDVEELKRRIAPVLGPLTRVAHRLCIGWEVSIWLSSYQTQALIDWLAPRILPWGCQHFIHFQQGWSHFDNDGPNATFASFWNRNVGKLHGIWHQRMQDPASAAWGPEETQYRMVDILERFAGGYFCSPDSGFGHPFVLQCLEITAMRAFNDGMSEAEQDAWARICVTTPAVNGPLGPVRVMGSGNGKA